MKRYPDQTCNGRRLMICKILVFSFLLSCPASSAPQRAGSRVWEVSVPSGKIGKGTFPLINDCSMPHFFRVTDNPVYVSFEPASGALPVDPKSSASITVIFDATQLAPGEYDFELGIACDTCKSEKGCNVKGGKKPVKMTVTAPAARQQSEHNVDPATVAALFADFFKTLDQLKREPLARDKRNARLLDGIAVSVSRLKEYSDRRSGPAAEQYLQSLRMNLEALKSLLKSTTGSGKPPSAIELASFRAGSYLISGAPTENPSGIAHIIRGTSPPRAASPRSPTQVLEVVDEDLKIKADHFNSSGVHAVGTPDLVQVSVVTKKDNKIVNGYEVWSVTLFWKDSREMRERFSTLTSPSQKALAPGSYIIGVNQSEGERHHIGGSPSQTVELRVH